MSLFNLQLRDSFSCPIIVASRNIFKRILSQNEEPFRTETL